MKAFEMTRPATAAQASQQLAAAGSVALAGGQDLLALLKDRVIEPDRVVNLKSLEAGAALAVRDRKLTIGALVTLRAVATDDTVKRGWPLLAQAAAEVGTPQIRNLATVGGNLCQQPRCWYYRSSAFGCARKGGDGCPAATGDHRYHAVFGGACLNPFLASLAIPLIAYGATVQIQGDRGPREMPLAELYPGDGRTTTTLGPGELVLGVSVPEPAGWRGAHSEVRFRQSQDWPLASASVLLRVQAGTVRESRIVLGAVAAGPYQPAAAVAALRGKAVTPELAAQAAEAAFADAQPLAQNGYKVTIARNLLRRTILQAAGMGDA